MNRKELIAILLLATVVAAGLVFHLYYGPVNAFSSRSNGSRTTRTTQNQSPRDASFAVKSRIPRSHRARELLQRAEGAFSYAVFSYAAGQENRKAILEAAAGMYRTFCAAYDDEDAVELAFLRIAQCYTVQKRYPEAARAYDDLIASYPRSQVRPMALLWSGEAHVQLGNIETARTRFQEAIDKYPDTHFAADAAARLDTLPKPKARENDGKPGVRSAAVPHATK
jgi:TolA-binding protein